MIQKHIIVRKPQKQQFPQLATLPLTPGSPRGLVSEQLAERQVKRVRFNQNSPQTKQFQMQVLNLNGDLMREKKTLPLNSEIHELSVSTNVPPTFEVKILEPIKIKQMQPVWLSERRFQDKIQQKRPDVVQFSQTQNLYFNKNQLTKKLRQRAAHEEEIIVTPERTQPTGTVKVPQPKNLNFFQRTPKKVSENEIHQVKLNGRRVQQIIESDSGFSSGVVELNYMTSKQSLYRTPEHSHHSLNYFGEAKTGLDFEVKQPLPEIIDELNSNDTANQSLELATADNEKANQVIELVSCTRAHNLKGLIYELMALYSGQKLLWNQYEKKWKIFDNDYINNTAPTPLSGQFLLVHHMAQVMNRKDDTGKKKIVIMDEENQQLLAIKQAFKNASLQLQMCRQSIIQRTNEASIYENIKKDLNQTYQQLISASY